MNEWGRFGGSSRYYDSQHAPGPADGAQESLFPQEGPVEPPRYEVEIRGVLKTFEANLETMVDRTVRQWNQTLRDALRSETGFKLTLGEQQRSVPVRVIPGLPPPFRKLLSDNPDPVLWEVYLRRGLLASAFEGLALLESRFDILCANLPQECARLADLAKSKRLVEHLLGRLKRSRVPEEFQTIQEDVLGAYFFRKPEIQIYWVVIALMAGVFDVSIEALTVVVLAHELAHAYTHLGLDIDGRDWDTESFAAADKGIVEGLAQHYTRILCDRRLKERYPVAGRAYHRLLAQQGGPYVVHTRWVADGDVIGEPVRLAMIRTRQNQLIRYTNFEGELNRARGFMKERNDRPGSSPPQGPGARTAAVRSAP